MTMHCAQRGCLIPDGTPPIEGMMCPTCNNPLFVVWHDEPDTSAEVSHEKQADEDVDLTAGVDEDDEQPLFDENGNPLFNAPAASSSESDMVG